MRRFLILFMVLVLFAVPVQGIEITAPAVPDFAEDYMPADPQNLTEGIRQILKLARERIRPDLDEAAKVCIGIAAVVMLAAMLQFFPGKNRAVTDLVGALSISVLMLSSAGALINLAADTVRQISSYGKLLLPVMTAALAAQGGMTSSAAIYTGTALFDSLLSALIARILIPLIYCYIALSSAGAAIGNDMLKKLRDGVKWAATWLLKTTLYIFTGYIGITGVISGATDAAALKAAKLTISGVVPVVGSILSDASEAVLVSAGTIKNAAGLYGLFAVIAIALGPFLKLGVHYVMLRVTGILCSIFGSRCLSDLIQDFASAMGMLLGMTGAVSLMLLISLVCYMKGMS